MFYNHFTKYKPVPALRHKSVFDIKIACAFRVQFGNVTNGARDPVESGWHLKIPLPKCSSCRNCRKWWPSASTATSGILLHCSDPSQIFFSPSLMFNSLTQAKYLLVTYPNLLIFMNYIRSNTFQLSDTKILLFGDKLIYRGQFSIIWHFFFYLGTIFFYSGTIFWETGQKIYS